MRSPERCEREYWQVDFFIPSGIFRSGLSKAKVKLGNINCTDARMDDDGMQGCKGKDDDVRFW